MSGKSLLFFGFLLLGWAHTEAQQLPQGSLTTLNPFVVNPAVSGAFDFADLRFGYRRQWQGLDDAPNTTFLTFHSPVGYGTKELPNASTPRYSTRQFSVPTPPDGTWRWGAGGLVVADRTGIIERNIVQATGAGHVSLPNKWRLSVGMGVGLLHYVLRFDRIQTATPSDPILPGGRVSLARPFLSLGMLVRHENFWAGASVLSPTALSLSYDAPAGDVQSRLLPHYYLTAAYRIKLSEEWAAIPQVWLKSTAKAPSSVDAQLRVHYEDRVWGGIQYRLGDSFGGILGLTLTPTLSLSYAYEYPLSSIQSTSVGSHEILLGFRFNNRRAMYSPPMGW